MTDNNDTSDGILENSPRTEDERIMVTNSPTVEPDSIISNQQTKMEVHHHPDLHHRRKKFREYFLEFIMIFLAVTLGYFAEQIREGFTDRQREEAYLNSMIQDLKVDTASLLSNIHLRQQRDIMIDSLILLLSSPDLKEYGNAIYYFGRSISPPISFFPDDRTIQQLKSTGSLRLISNMRVSNSIMDYDRKMRQEIFEYTDEQDVRGELRQIAIKIFDGKVLNEMIRNKGIDRPINNPKLVSYDVTLINECIVQTQYLRKVNQLQLTRAQELFVQAKQLMELIKKEYHVE